MLAVPARFFKDMAMARADMAKRGLAQLKLKARSHFNLQAS